MYALGHDYAGLRLVLVLKHVLRWHQQTYVCNRMSVSADVFYGVNKCCYSDKKSKLKSVAISK